MHRSIAYNIRARGTQGANFAVSVMPLQNEVEIKCISVKKYRPRKFDENTPRFLILQIFI